MWHSKFNRWRKCHVIALKCSVASHKLINRLSKLVDLSGYSSISLYTKCWTFSKYDFGLDHWNTKIWKLCQPNGVLMEDKIHIVLMLGLCGETIWLLRTFIVNNPEAMEIHQMLSSVKALSLHELSTQYLENWLISSHCVLDFFFGLHGFDFFPPGLLKHSNISEHNSYQVIGRCSWRHFIVGLFIVKNNYEHKDTMFGDLPWTWNQYFVSDSSFCEFCRLWPIYLLLDFKPIWDTVLGDLFHQCFYDWKKRHYFGQDISKLYFWGTRRTLTPTLLYILIVRRLDSVADGKSEPMFYVLESPLNWGHGSEVVVQHSSIGGISASVIMWTFFLAAGQVMISHAWTVCTDAWLVGHHQPDINIYILNENFL